MTVTVMEVAGSVADGALGDGDEENSRRCWDPGGWLIDERRRLDVREAAWLLTLAQFDRDQGWAADGHLSCVAWLQFHTHMARATAFEKLQVAHQLKRRPTLAEALRSGRISYSAARLIARMDHPDPEVDEAVIDLAAGGSLRDVERVVRRYHEYRDQDQPPVDLEPSRGVRVRGLGDGTTRVEITVTDLEAAELVAALDAFTPAARPADRSDWGPRRADGWMDMARCALASPDRRGAAGDDRYLVHLVVRDGQMTSVDGSPVPRAAAATVCCDTATVVHHQDGAGEPLALGRRTREWSTAQRRAALVRDGGRCRFPGCDNTWVDLHHLHWWTKGGPTDLANGLSLCRRHHTFIHHHGDDIVTAGDANHRVEFRHRDGTVIGSTGPIPVTATVAR